MTCEIGIQYRVGEYLHFTDGNIWMSPDYVLRVRVIENNSNANIIHLKVKVINYVQMSKLYPFSEPKKGSILELKRRPQDAGLKWAQWKLYPDNYFKTINRDRPNC